MQGPPTLPDNAVYMRIAYAIVCAMYFGYVLLLWRRNASINRRLQDREIHGLNPDTNSTS